MTCIPAYDIRDASHWSPLILSLLVSFALLIGSGVLLQSGWRGRFNQPNLSEKSLRDGLQVRIFCSSVYILRIEIAA